MGAFSLIVVINLLNRFLNMEGDEYDAFFKGSFKTKPQNQTLFHTNVILDRARRLEHQHRVEEIQRYPLLCTNDTHLSNNEEDFQYAAQINKKHSMAERRHMKSQNAMSFGTVIDEVS